MRVISEVPHVVASIVHLSLVGACIVAWQSGHWLVTTAFWVALVWCDHAALARLHEAVHGMLSRSRWRNEAWGLAIGTLSLIPMSVYRYVHKRHHAELGGVRDPEFWPYNRPGARRGVCLAYAAAELALGALVTPALYTWRTFRAWPKHRTAMRRRLVLECVGLVAFWVAVFALTTALGWWPYLLVAHVVPAWLTGVVQTVRKFTEHLGRRGTTIPALTRSVDYQSHLGRLASATQLHVDHHGTHHRWPRIPYRNLPEATALMREHDPAEPFPSHLAAFRDLVSGLRDPSAWARIPLALRRPSIDA